MAAAANSKVRALIPIHPKPMLAKLVAEPFHTDGWVYEEKYDGIRILSYKQGDAVKLISRNGVDRTQSFPEVVAAIAKLRAKTLLLDGEMVAFDRQGISRFQLLQMGKGKPVYAVFDCLYIEGEGVRLRPQKERRRLLEKAIADADRKIVFASKQMAGDGMEAFRAAGKKGLEGIVAKDGSSPYVEGRSSYWLKVKIHQEDEFVIGGYTRPEGTREHFGALLVGAYANGKLRFAGKVGTGFSRETLAQLYRKFQPLARKKTAFENPPREAGVTWLAPKFVGQFAYQEWTADAKLRQPVFLGLRDDKRAEEVTFPKELKS
jgi:bifunctional non-homologous end joining protein LigD